MDGYRGPTSTVCWVGGYDLAGIGALTNIAEGTEAMAANVTPLGPQGAIVHEQPIGRVAYTFTEKGFLSQDQVGIRDLLKSGAPAQPWRAIVGYVGDTTGAMATVVSHTRLRKSQINPDPEGVSMVDLEYYNDTEGEVYDTTARLVHGGQRVDTAPAVPYTAYQLDGGAASADGSALCLMADGIDWDGATSLAIKLRHSANKTGGAASWADLGPTLTVTPTTAPGQVFAKTTGAVRRYVALTWAWTGGTAPTAKIIAAIARL